jgi:riboflavin kinase/FMN adenylyltransferase
VHVRYELARESERPLVLAIGFFDGFHRGHREIARATRLMRRPGWRCGVLTFSNHPASFLRPGTEPAMLSTAQERIDLFARAQFEECLFVKFDKRISTLSPDAFLGILVERVGVRGIAVGSTFRFGHKRTGDVSFMQRYLSQRGLGFTAVEPVTADGERISSTRIRGLVAAGDLDSANDLLGGVGYELRGTVELGQGRGHDLGFPTANIRVPEKLLPRDGIYSATARYDGRDYAALVSIGTNPQFDGRARTIEAWLRDFYQTIYGREVALRTLRFVREQKRFETVAELVDQMQKDREAVAYPSYG